MSQRITAPVRVGGWQFIQDENGSEVGRRLYMPDAGGWIVESWTIENGVMVRRPTFVPCLSDWLVAVGGQVSAAIARSAVPETLGLIIAKTETIMSGTNELQQRLEAMAAEIAALETSVSAGQGLVDGLKRITVELLEALAAIPATIEQAVQDALARGDITDAAEKTFKELQDRLAASAATLQQSVTDLTATSQQLDDAVTPEPDPLPDPEPTPEASPAKPA